MTVRRRPDRCAAARRPELDQRPAHGGAVCLDHDAGNLAALGQGGLPRTAEESEKGQSDRYAGNSDRHPRASRSRRSADLASPPAGRGLITELPSQP